MKGSLFCNIHPSYEVNLIRFHKDINQVLSCSCCVEEQDEFSEISTLGLAKMLEANQNTFFSNWPPYEKESSQELKKELQKIFSSIDFVKNKQEIDIKKHFSDLRVEIEKKISEIEDKYLLEVKNHQDRERIILDEYNSVSRKQEIQQIIKDEGSTVQQKNAQLKQLTDAILREKPNYTQKLQGLVKKIEDQQLLNFAQLEKVRHQILGNLEGYQKHSQSSNDQQKKHLEKEKENNLQIISQILRNPFNQCSVSFIDLCEQVIESNYYLFKDIFLFPVHQPDQIKIPYQSLRENQVQDILKLAETISLLPPNSTIQSEEVVKTKRLFDRYLSKVSQQDLLQKLLVKYPIFELVPELSDVQLINPILIKSDYGSSSQAIVILNQNTLYAQIDYKYSQLQCCCGFILNPHLKYIFKVELPKNENRKNLQFGFGLGRDSLLCHNLFEQRMMYFSDGKWGIDKHISGDNLTDASVSSKINNFVIKISLSENILIVSDQSNCNNVVSFDNTRMKKLPTNNDLRFFINLTANYKNGDWIKISSIETVNSFY